MSANPKRFTVHVPNETYEKILKLAEINQKSISSLIREVLEREISLADFGATF